MELRFGLAGVHLHVEDFVELVASGHLLYFALGHLFEHLQFAQLAVHLVDQVLVLPQLLHHWLTQSRQRFVHFLSGYEVVLIFQQA